MPPPDPVIQTVESQIQELEDLEKTVPTLRRPTPDDTQPDDQEQVDEDQSTTASSETSCSEGSSTEAAFTTCTRSAITEDGTTTTTYNCDTSTSYITGCDVTASGTATTLSASASATPDCDDVCIECQPDNTEALRRRWADRNVTSLSKRTLNDPHRYTGDYYQYNT